MAHCLYLSSLFEQCLGIKVWSKLKDMQMQKTYRHEEELKSEQNVKYLYSLILNFCRENEGNLFLNRSHPLCLMCGITPKIVV